MRDEQGKKWKHELDKNIFRVLYYTMGDSNVGVRENKVENYLDERVRQIGGLTRKWISTNQVGVPDRIVIVEGDIWFVEVKTADGKLSPMQVREHQRLRDVGARVTTVYGTNGVDKFIEELTC